MEDWNECEKWFKKYKAATGGKEPIGFIVPDGLPYGVEEHGGIVETYKECIKKRITWEELLDYHEDGAII